ncbi:hypothetical protein DO97_20365 [Neosynechococcus sphagnicola sy1]|uniref:L-threonylcarbamoyladenylate synthase n=1 Tax=Neosynechococcus sphagnicola sy1 TaxID=1497020 RepID=A0A098TRK0_9CYAN|nr:L-threonylcarbamoyladenylate synthase [Neosynechococcus sphagnicola]KGF73428.1 hypothetical protein DO97_20365 [Neosynechococcus sphagnicola sy1]
MPQVTLYELVAGASSGSHLISFPTDTVPALAARPDCSHLIFAAKQRSLDKPLILMAATPEDLWPYVAGTPTELNIWQKMTQQYWPGALTLVLPASSRVPPQIHPRQPTTIGLRVPDRAIARTILAQTGPLATTSANRSGQPALQTMAAIAAAFPEVLTPLLADLVAIEGSSAPTLKESGVTLPSTIAKWSGVGWEILRQGSVRLKI